MSKKLVYCILGVIFLILPAAVSIAQPLLPATPTAAVSFPQEKTPQSRLTLKMLPQLQQQIITHSMTSSLTLPEKIAQQKIFIQHFVFIGNTVFDGEKLSQIVGIENKLTTLGQLYAAINQITVYYHKKGYLLAHAYLPEQTVKEGNVIVRVVEGNIDAIILENHSKVFTASVRAIVDSHFKIGKPLNNKAANRAIMILRNTPGIGNVIASLKPGARSGTTAVMIIVSPGKKVTGNIGVNNYATRFSGKYQLNLAANINNVTHHGDLIGLLGGISKNALTDNGRVFWEIPLGSHGLRSGLAFTRSDYQIGDSLSSLGAHGEASAASLYGRYPLYLSPLTQTNLDYSLDHRWFVDNTKSTGTSFPKKIDAFALTLSGNVADKLFHRDAVNTWSVANTVGELFIEDGGQRSLDLTTAKTNGWYDKMVFLLSRDQSLSENLSLYLSGNGQWSEKNLDSSEQFALGGPFAIRAYPSGEAGGDEGVYGTIELRDQLLHWLQMSIFYDAGKVWFNKNPYIQQSNTRVIAGPGVGVNVKYKKFTFNTALAVRNTGHALSDYDERPRFWFQAQYDFA